MDGYLSVAKIVNTHGIRGEIKVVPQTDFPEERFAEGSRLTLFPPESMNQAPFTVTVQKARPQKNTYIVQLAGFQNINQVEKWKGGMLKISRDQLVDLGEDEYYYHEIIGCRVFDEDGIDVGEITDILAPGANDVWVATGEDGRELLIPVIDDVLLRVDIERKQVHICIMEGMR